MVRPALSLAHPQLLLETPVAPAQACVPCSGPHTFPPSFHLLPPGLAGQLLVGRAVHPQCSAPGLQPEVLHGHVGQWGAPENGALRWGGWGVTCVSPGFQASVLLLGGTSACPATSRHHPSTPSQGRCSASFPGSRVSVVPAPEPLSQVPRCWEALIPGVSLRPSRLPLLLTPITGHQRPASEDRQSSPAVAALCWPRGKPG